MDEKELYQALEALTSAPSWRAFEWLVENYSSQRLQRLAQEPKFGRVRFLQGCCAASREILDLPHDVMKSILEGRWKEDGERR